LLVTASSASRFPGAPETVEGASAGLVVGDVEGVRLRVEYLRLKLLRWFEELLCLEGLHGLEQLPHQVETVRKSAAAFSGTGAARG
jgi:hypothetical protein